VSENRYIPSIISVEWTQKFSMMTHAVELQFEHEITNCGCMRDERDDKGRRGSPERKATLPMIHPIENERDTCISVGCVSMPQT